METISLVFILSSLLIIITPGQDMVLVMSRSFAQGKKAGLMTAFGISSGLLIHTVLAALGLGSLLQSSEFLFTIIKFVGAGYLIYFGLKLLLDKNANLDVNSLPKVSYKKMFVQGALSNIMNPKIAIFYFAYLPQFITPNSQNPTYELLVLGITYAILAFFVKAPIGLVSGILSFWIQTKPMVLKWINRTSGTIVILLGIKLALEKK